MGKPASLDLRERVIFAVEREGIADSDVIAPTIPI
jgi:hypothetical protein